MAFWMGVASAEHARGGRDGGFAQLGHGKHIAVKSLKKGDWIVYYSPREGMGTDEVVQAYTTIGTTIGSVTSCRVDVNSESQQSCKIKAWPWDRSILWGA